VNVYVLSDMEGLSMVTEWEQVRQGGELYTRYQPILTLEVNAAIEGAIAAGAKRIVVNDGHGSKDYNLLWEHLHTKAEVERPDSSANVLPSIQEDFDAILLIGYHAMEGTPNAVMPHTQNHDQIQYYEINGERYGEIGQMAMIAGDFGVPVVFISGDLAAVNEARKLLGEDLPATIVKRGLANGKAVSLHPLESAKRIREEVEKALKMPKRKPYVVEGPCEVKVKYKRNKDVFEEKVVKKKVSSARLILT
jgi:D-amino peptidase